MKGFPLLCGIVCALALPLTYAEIIPNGTVVTNQSYGRNTIDGPANLKEMMYVSLTVNGPTDLNHLTVTQDFKVNGPLSGAHLLCGDLTVTGPVEGNDFTLQSLMVHGPVNLTNVTVKGAVTINGGPVSILQGKLQNLTVAAKSIKLMSTTVGSIVIRKVDEEKQQLILEGTQVNGTIFFESGKGEMIATGSSISGKVEGLAPSPPAPTP